MTPRSNASPRLWSRIAGSGRALAFLLLAGLTAWGVYVFATGDWQAALGYWRGHYAVLPVVVALGALDVACEALAALWVYQRFGVRAFDAKGGAALLSMRAGLLLPAQLARVIRPDSFVRLERGSAKVCLQAEGATFLLDVLSVVAVCAALFLWRMQWPWAGVAAAGLVVTGGLLAGRALADWLRDTRFALPRHFWWKPASFGIVALEASAWLAHGAAFWVLVRGLPGEASGADAILATAVASLVGASSGAPGGVGVTDGLLGASLRWMQVPVEHLALVVVGFRLATFWLWIPIGWLALALTRRESPNRASSLTRA